LADVVIENDYNTQHVDHAFLQPEAVLAYVDERGHMVVQTATQYAHYDRGEIAHALGLRFSQVQVKTLAVGGAFGGREDISLQIIAALVAWTTLRPVKMENLRHESFYSHSKRHPMRMHYKTGATKEGKLVAMEAKMETLVLMHPGVSMFCVSLPYMLPDPMSFRTCPLIVMLSSPTTPIQEQCVVLERLKQS